MFLLQTRYNSLCFLLQTRYTSLNKRYYYARALRPCQPFRFIRQVRDVVNRIAQFPTSLFIIHIGLYVPSASLYAPRSRAGSTYSGQSKFYNFYLSKSIKRIVVVFQIDTMYMYQTDKVPHNYIFTWCIVDTYLL